MFLLLALLAFFAIALPDAMLGVVWPSMRTTFNQPLAAMTLVLPFGVAATVVSTSCWSWAARRLGLGRLLTASIALSAVALLCCALAPAYWVIVACAVLFGLSAGAVDAALNAFAARHFGARHVNLMHAAYGVGAATSPLIVTLVVGAGRSWRAAYVLVLVIQAGLAVVFAITSRRWDRPAGVGTSRTAGPVDDGPPNPARWWRRRRFLVGLVVVGFEAGLESTVGLWAFVYLLDVLALAPTVAGALVSGYWAAIVVGRIGLGTLAERIGVWPLLAALTVAIATGGALLVTRQPVLVGAGIVVFGLAAAPVYPFLVLTTGERSDSAGVDRAVGLQAAVSTVGAVVFPSAVGLIMGVDSAAFGPCALVLALAVAGGLWVVRPGHRRAA